MEKPTDPEMNQAETNQPAEEIIQQEEEEITLDQVNLPVGRLPGVLKFFKSFTKREWILLAVSTVIALIGAAATITGGYYSGPYMAKIAEINATMTKEAALTQSAEHTVVANASMMRTPSAVLPSATATQTATPGPTPTFLPTYFQDQPYFDINVLTYTDQTDTFEVTNNLIGARDEITMPENNYKVASSSLELEIHPNYLGDRTFGSLDLRITGKGGAPIIKHLWDDFDDSSSTQKVVITFPEIISISGIQYSDFTLQSNLRVGEEMFRKSPITLEVIRSSDPKSPFPSIKTITVVNTPWRQEASVVSREGHLYLDYYVKNFGRDGNYGYQLQLVKTIGPVTDNTHPVWSGTDLLQTGPNSKLFFLKTGESYQESILLPDELDKGRYIVQIYTYKALEYIKFEPSYNFPDYDDAWMFANSGHRIIFIKCADRGQTCSEAAVDAIERHGISVTPVKDDSGGGSASFTAGSYPVDDYITSGYTVNYAINTDKGGWAGISIGFAEPVDVNRYNALQFKFQFKDDRSPLWLDIGSTDPDTKNNKWSRVLIGGGTYGKQTTEEQTITVPLADLTNTDLRNVIFINVISDDSLVHDAAEHEFTIRQIEFVDTTSK